MGCELEHQGLFLYAQVAALIFYILIYSLLPPIVDFGVQSTTKYDFNYNIMNELFMLKWLGLYFKV